MIFREHENEKRKYQQRVLDVEMGFLTPLVFRTNSGMGTECHAHIGTVTSRKR